MVAILYFKLLYIIYIYIYMFSNDYTCMYVIIQLYVSYKLYANKSSQRKSVIKIACDRMYTCDS